MQFRVFGLVCVVLLIPKLHFGQMQDCTLGIGNKDTEVIYQVFKLSGEQQVVAEALAAEYQKNSRLIQEEVDLLFESHPQATPEDLQKMAKKFDSLKVALTTMSRTFDQKLVGIFNEKQYEVYLQLCNEVMRKPLVPYRD
ncbi:hypothetical protein [Lentiprolixibacter aurantiacus]|uniref:Uncharacterized protein n=1 Tax=Lentiprolixibacter aurantiacus TaxID=2993939 RepID=A0AAE3MMG3_9FLAO|nr:hypothetical protein [Lentiprolixibacter aurantiacus]MCX2720500.1 hypothetical protein [Lentiprolixibacter aurantiacus]